ncbi:bifunctional oligoribonuclease/PAP phosphatase NrnA [Acetobacterium wieringae]|jgi:phosphoesterase RecJ-like protein|uniref:Bifunctional oligoribonuclease and PAP phosphatase NrnA n=1 Tax=Acetobacterium wieringae TaxID=52694 RepID=A0A1F2PDJ8_9FIRM|nr:MULTISPECIES: bifunctional oligoribonuclease/PAP phosphatase NrnA [Acetobacterium]HAZ05048.1 bifunctional oligoribonuclease/PAP phosphatase NrnA [Acetobacterium sp.]MEA4804834.1 bifunctional oligoribonuclease/PAP phosphatase NrnA [Acetobacterium wieringae]OFV69479.1 bifunctional oligoribonuclease and PAP phosphatase NrnA [Acetobacterium wieringae]OXS26227.1 MAG: recombinase RecJ [Acetobacterium sp. MES1]TYC87140.1 bifunctional oligoribonuclease/PAP phosphatase NrnA [Acetobacterium wieringae
MNTIPDEILNCLCTNQRFLILLHQKPDGDAIGSAVALGKGLKQLNKTVDYYIDLPLEDKLEFFDEIQYFNQVLQDDYDVIIYLDCSSSSFAFSPAEMPAAKIRLVIDHHKSNAHYGDLNFVEITGATAEIVFRVLRGLNVVFDEEMADAIFTGITTDTGSFQFSNVTVDTHLIASELYAIKTNYAHLSKRLHTQKNINQMKMTGAAIHSLEILDSMPIAMMILDHETIVKFGGTINITDDVANLGQNTIGVAITALLKEIDPGEYRVSLRAKYPYDIHEIALKYGGGGHERAAGFNFCGDVGELKRDLMEVCANQNGEA